jgi:hypothetical protein
MWPINRDPEDAAGRNPKPDKDHDELRENPVEIKRGVSKTNDVRWHEAQIHALRGEVRPEEATGINT